MINHFSSLQYLPVPVRYTHQSMPIIETLSTELREAVPVVWWLVNVAVSGKIVIRMRLCGQTV